MIRGDLTARDHFDWPLFIGIVLIAMCGAVNLYSATSVYQGARAELYISQVQWLVVGGILGGLMVVVDYRHLERLGYLVYAFGVFCLCLVFVVAPSVRGASRWIPLGSFQFQPSELMKLFLVIALAKYLHDDPRNEPRTLGALAKPALITAVPAVLVLLQPDLGTASILVAIFFTIAAMTRIRWKSVLTFVVTVALAAPLSWAYVLRGYQKDRILVFLNPEADILHRGWHAHHAKVAIGDGGFWGSGFMRGSQNQFGFIPDQYTDFPFPVFAEEWGFVGAFTLVCLYGFVSLWALRVAALAKDRFGAVLAVGGAAIVFWHALINMGMALGVLPVVGVTLPFVSYGGSSMITMLLAISLVMNVSMRRHASVPTGRRLL